MSNQVHKKENGIYVRDIDPVLSLLSASYKLIKTYSDRFCQRHPPKPIEYTWNIHYEDRMWAHAVIVYTVRRQFDIADTFKTPMPGTHKCLDISLLYHYRSILKPEIYGYGATEMMRSVQILPVIFAYHFSGKNWAYWTANMISRNRSGQRDAFTRHSSSHESTFNHQT